MVKASIPAIIVASLFVSCSSLYMPNVPATPMMSARNELHAAGHISLKGNISLNTAYSPGENFAIMVNGSTMNRDGRKENFRQGLAEAAAGYYTTFGPDKNRIFELYTGFGRGNSERFKTDDAQPAGILEEIRFRKMFVQANYSSKREHNLNLFGARFPMNFGTALRLSYVNMKDFQINQVDQEKEDNIFLEPVFFTRLPLSRAVQIQYTNGSNFGLKNRKFLTAGNSVFTLGLVVSVR